MSNRHPELDRMMVKDFLVAYGRPPDSITIGEMLEIYRAQALILQARAKPVGENEEEADPFSVIDLSEHAEEHAARTQHLLEQFRCETPGELGVPMPEIERFVRQLRQGRAASSSSARLEELAKRFGVPAINLSSFEINDEALALVPREISQKYRLIPVNLVRSTLIVAMANPSDIYAIDNLKFITGCSIEVVVASEEDITRAIARYYP